jgi:hypothetical protein
VSEGTRSETGMPGWVAVAIAVIVVVVGIWLIGAVMSAIGFLVKLALSVAVIAVIAWFLINAVTKGSNRD